MTSSIQSTFIQTRVPKANHEAAAKNRPMQNSISLLSFDEEESSTEVFKVKKLNHQFKRSHH